MAPARRERARGLFFALLILGALGCSSPTRHSYRPAEGAAGGYGFRDAAMDGGRHYVRFDGHSGVPPHHAEDYALLRAAEVTLAHGYPYFVVVDFSDHTQRVTTYTSSSSTTTSSTFGSMSSTGYGSTTVYPSYRLTIQMVDSDSLEGHLFYVDAHSIVARLRPKYGLEALPWDEDVATSPCSLGRQP